MLDLKVMAKVQIRRYQEEDHEEVKEVFTLGMSEHIPSSCMHVLKQPLAQMFLGCVFCALLTSSMSILLPVLAVTLLLAAGRQSVSYMFNKYIQTSLEQDLNHIQQTYLDPPNACFWVAESQGCVVGTVACLPAEKDLNFLELKRMSVKKTHRGQGIAKTLCRTVADFAQWAWFSRSTACHVGGPDRCTRSSMSTWATRRSANLVLQMRLPSWLISHW